MRERVLSSVSFADSLKSLSPGKPRKLLMETAELLDRWNPGEVITLTAPTGYGKTTLSLSLAKAVISGNREIAERIIHVLPLRAIGDDLYLKARETFFYLKPFVKYVGLQHMGRMDSPLLGRRFNITTLDTFVMSLFKLPPFELHKVHNDYDAHYEVSRGFILTSMVVFDEVHLFLSEKKSRSAFIASLESLVESNVPVLLSTATLPRSHLEKLKERVEAKNGKFIVVGPEAEDAPKRKVKVETFNGDPVTKARELSSKGSLLVVMNTVRGAVDFYRKLKGVGLSPLLLHGRMTERHRQEVLSSLLGENRTLREGEILVATQVVEAGVDVSAGSMITEVSPVESLLQRMGRVARYEGQEGEVYVIPGSDGVYEESRIKETWEMVEKGRVEIPQEREFEMDDYLHKALYELHRNLFTKSQTAVELLNRECSFTREGELIKVVPEEKLNSPHEGEYLGVERDLLNRIVDKVVGGLKRTAQGPVLVQLDKNFFNSNPYDRCISLKMMRMGIDSVVVKGYDDEVGLVG